MAFLTWVKPDFATKEAFPLSACSSSKAQSEIFRNADVWFVLNNYIQKCIFISSVKEQDPYFKRKTGPTKMPWYRQKLTSPKK
jgi:hypothetical protein